MKTKRVNYLINSKYQIKFAAKFALLTLMLLGLVLVQLYVVIWPTLGRLVPEETMDFIVNQMFSRAIIFLFVAILATIVFAIIISHRVAGPIFTMHRTVKKILRGEANEFVKLRKNDEFQSFAKDLNGLIAIIEENRKPSLTNVSIEKNAIYAGKKSIIFD